MNDRATGMRTSQTGVGWLTQTGKKKERGGCSKSGGTLSEFHSSFNR